jgi:hypothetical protein
VKNEAFQRQSVREAVQERFETRRLWRTGRRRDHGAVMDRVVLVDPRLFMHGAKFDPTVDDDPVEAVFARPVGMKKEGHHDQRLVPVQVRDRAEALHDLLWRFAFTRPVDAARFRAHGGFDHDLP